MFEKVLVANRGEIAVRVIRALEELGIASVAVYSEIDRDALHVQRADEAYLLGRADGGRELPERRQDPRGLAASPAPRRCIPATASWPRTPPFARACEEAGIVFIGPPASAIEAMGSKTRARELMQEAGVPIVPGTTEPVADVEDARDLIADEIGYPVAVKAAGGGGGKGFRVALARGRAARRPSRAPRARARSSSPTRPSTSSATCPTRATSRSRCWPTGTATSIHLGERDCSIQRRHQKLIEESPAPAGRRGAARADRQDRHRRRARGRLPRRGHDRGPAAGRRVLLPGDEHARAGRALRDRDGHRHRHRQGGHPAPRPASR